MKDITHIVRPNLPWRDENQTECGLDATRHPTWTRNEVRAKGKELGRQRLSMFVCMTCLGTAERHRTWEEDPASCMNRYAERMSTRWIHDNDDERRRFRDELVAIALLIDAHRPEFDELVTGLSQVDDMATLANRRAERKKAGRVD